MSGSGGKSKEKGSSKVQIPDFLRPLFERGSQIAATTLGNLNQNVNVADDLAADFTPAQIASQNLAVQEALDGTYIPAAQDTLLGATQGKSLDQILDPTALASLRGMSGGQNILPEETYQALVNSSVSGGLPQATTDALTSTAQGDFLYGGEGFNAALDAAMRQIRPQLISTFGAAGSGGGTGGLAQTAIGQATADVFANQYGRERQNQLSAASQLGGLTQSGQQGAASLLGQTGASSLQNALAASQALTGASERERLNQLNAARGLPDIGTAGIDLLGDVGAEQQQQAQREIDAPIERQLALLSAALGLDFGSLLGQKDKRKKGFIGFSGLPLA